MKDETGFDYHTYQKSRPGLMRRTMRAEFPADGQEHLVLDGAQTAEVQVVDEQDNPVEQAKVTSGSLFKPGASAAFNWFYVEGP